MNERKVTFKLKGKMPEELTIDRLATYLRALGNLVGDENSVRICSIGRGSVKVALAVKDAYYPEFVHRVAGSKNPKLATDATARAVERLEALVTDDRISAEFIAAGQKILQLHGYRHGSDQVMGPISQPLTVRGRILGLEGKDRTKHARIQEYGTSREISGEIVDNELALRLKEDLWGEVVELVGLGRMMRLADGVWEIRGFRIEAVRRIDPAKPSEVFAQLREAIKGTDLEGASAADIKAIRN